MMKTTFWHARFRFYSLNRLTMLTVLCLLAGCMTLAACSPRFDWREVRSTEPAFTMLMPAKAASFSRDIRLNGLALTMQMTAADVGDAHFAVGCIKVDDPTQLMAVMAAMKQGMVANIRGTITVDKPGVVNDMEAHGVLQNGQPVYLRGRFLVRGKWVVQVIAMGAQKTMTPEVIDTFLTSFKMDAD